MKNNKANILEIPQLDQVIGSHTVSDISCALDQQAEKVPINNIPWPDAFPYTPDVHFRMAYNQSEIFLKYQVHESYLRAKVKSDNGPVYQDSCVEFFIKSPTENHYYNFEFNCIGTCLMQVGFSRDNREFAPGRLMGKIQRISSLGQHVIEEKSGDFTWDLVVIIPLETLFLDNLSNLQGIEMHANFYKCGDLLTCPHYLSWNPIRTSDPDFHRPEDFGILVFK